MLTVVIISSLLLTTASESVIAMEPMSAKKSIVVIGASYAGDWKPGRLAGYEIINKGISGQQSFELLARLEKDALQLKPDAVIIWGFINDVFRSDRSGIDHTLRRTRESLVSMVKMVKEAGISPILATEVTVSGNHSFVERIKAMVGRVLRRPSYEQYINGHVLETNRWIREFAMREGVLLVDFEVVLADGHGSRRKEFSQPDGSHISQAGYQALSSYMENVLQKSLRPT
jgi:lysophospholipase L1-like esterase